MILEIGGFEVGDQVHLLDKAEWREQKNESRHYLVSEIDTKSVDSLGLELSRAWLMRIPPGGRVHPHADKPKRTWHYVLETNPQCLFYSGADAVHMEAGRIYEVDRGEIHWSENLGTTNRTHLMVVF